MRFKIPFPGGGARGRPKSGPPPGGPARAGSKKEAKVAKNQEVLANLGEVLAAAAAAAKSWRPAAAAAADPDAKIGPEAAKCAEILENLYRVCRSRRGAAAQNALLAAMRRGSAAAAVDPEKFGIGA